MVALHHHGTTELENNSHRHLLLTPQPPRRAYCPNTHCNGPQWPTSHPQPDTFHLVLPQERPCSGDGFAIRNDPWEIVAMGGGDNEAGRGEDVGVEGTEGGGGDDKGVEQTAKGPKDGAAEELSHGP
jgi:hypothetical protein